MQGGYRLGAGRKKGVTAKNYEEARKYLSDRVSAELVILTDVLIRKAKFGDMRAMRELLDRAWGRPQQAIQVESSYKPTPILNIAWEPDERFDLDANRQKTLVENQPIFSSKTTQKSDLK